MEPEEVGYYNTPGSAKDIFVENDIAYIADGAGGMQIVRFDGVDQTQQDHPKLPNEISLQQNLPNPFNPTTTIRYTIRKPQIVRLNLYNIHGRLVRTLFDGMKADGEYELILDGSRLASGVYLYELKSEQYSICRKMLLIK